MPKTDLVFRSNLLNVEGMLGFAPDARNTPGYHQLGAFITNPVSLASRSPAEHRAAIRYPGGSLLHSGFPNGGLVKTLRKYRHAWESAAMPVILHLLAEDLNGMEQSLRIIEEMDCLAGLEVSFRPGTPAGDAARILNVAMREWPVIAQLDDQEAGAIVPLLESEGLTAISMAHLRGLLARKNGSAQPEMIHGRLFGPALYPQTLLRLDQFQQFGVPIIASGGIVNSNQAAEVIQAGALAVKLDTVFWNNTFNFLG